MQLSAIITRKLTTCRRVIKVSVLRRKHPSKVSVSPLCNVIAKKLLKLYVCHRYSSAGLNLAYVKNNWFGLANGQFWQSEASYIYLDIYIYLCLAQLNECDYMNIPSYLSRGRTQSGGGQMPPLPPPSLVAPLNSCNSTYKCSDFRGMKHNDIGYIIAFLHTVFALHQVINFILQAL